MHPYVMAVSAAVTPGLEPAYIQQGQLVPASFTTTFPDLILAPSRFKFGCRIAREMAGAENVTENGILDIAERL